MIRLTIQRKVFLATFVLATILVVLLALAMRWNLGQGFERYTTAAEFARLDWLIRNVEAEYAAHGNWDFVRADPERVWRRMSRPGPANRQDAPGDGRLADAGRGDPPLPDEFDRRPPRPPWDDRPPPAEDGSGPPGLGARPAPRQQEPGGERPPTQAGASPPGPAPQAREAPADQPPRPSDPPRDRTPPANDPLRIGPRLALLDADGTRIAGNADDKGIGAVRPIQFRGKQVGKLTLQASPTSVQELDAAFLASQTQNMLFAGLAALGLSLLAAWLLARHLLAPIRDLTAGARRIAEGWLDARIPVGRDDELGELADNFNAMAQRLGKVEESRRAWISDASHELRTPLAVLRAEIEALQDGVRTPDAATLVRLHKQVQQLATLVDDLRLTLDREPGIGDLEHLPFSPLAVLDETVAAFRERYAQAGIALEAKVTADSGARIRGDAGRMTQVFTNLLENSLRYTDPGGRLRIAARVESARLTLQFDDSAPAPPRAALPHLFERFFRAEASRSRSHGGSGLGLAICKALVEAHAGCISAGFSDLGGLAIRIELPVEKS